MKKNLQVLCYSQASTNCVLPEIEWKKYYTFLILLQMYPYMFCFSVLFCWSLKAEQYRYIYLPLKRKRSNQRLIKLQFGLFSNNKILLLYD